MVIFICLISFVVILYRALRVASRASYRTWRGPRWRFWLLAFAFASLAAGALGVAFGLSWSGYLVTIGAAAYMLADRRTAFPPCGGAL